MKYSYYSIYYIDTNIIYIYKYMCKSPKFGGIFSNVNANVKPLHLLINWHAFWKYITYKYLSSACESIKFRLSHTVINTLQDPVILKKKKGSIAEVNRWKKHSSAVPIGKRSL